MSLVILGLLHVIAVEEDINIYITSVAAGGYAVAHVNIITAVCLPLIRIRIRNDYAWTPVFDKNKSKDKKKETKRSVTKYNGPTLFICTS